MEAVGVRKGPAAEVTAAEATAVGNILMQALCLGAVENVAEIRRIVRNSFPLKTFTPRDSAGWDEAFQRFLGLVEDS